MNKPKYMESFEKAQATERILVDEIDRWVSACHESSCDPTDVLSALGAIEKAITYLLRVK